MYVGATLITGFPGETEEDFHETCRWLEQNVQYIDGLSIFLPAIQEGSPLHRQHRDYGIKAPLEVAWESADGTNTLSTRIWRRRLLYDFLGALGSPHDEAYLRLHREVDCPRMVNVTLKK